MKTLSELKMEISEWQAQALKQMHDETLVMTPENVRILFGFETEGPTNCVVTRDRIITPWGEFIPKKY